MFYAWEGILCYNPETTAICIWSLTLYGNLTQNVMPKKGSYLLISLRGPKSTNLLQYEHKIGLKNRCTLTKFDEASVFRKLIKTANVPFNLKIAEKS